MARTNLLDLQNITAEMPVIGFTGALGSGCTYLSKGLVQHYNYAYCSLSEAIHEAAREAGEKETTRNLQDIGNEVRRRYGRDALVRLALQRLDRSLPHRESSDGTKGVVVDGIRNAGEVEALRGFPNFFLISVQAGTGVRKHRTVDEGIRFDSEDDFLAADSRDQDEQMDCGQQVKECNYQADIIVLNEPAEETSTNAHKPYRDYIREALYDPYISLI